MPILVKMGAVSPTMSSGHVVEWKVKVGDRVKEGDTIADVQTDKAVMPLESFDEGTVAQLLVEPGQEVAVGADVLLLAAKGEDPKIDRGVAGKPAAKRDESAKAASAATNGEPADHAREEPVSHELAAHGARADG